MKRLVLPIEDINVLHEVENALLHNFRERRRNHTIFQVGKTTLFRMSGMLVLRRGKICKTDGDVKKNAYIRDEKTRKPNILYLRPVKQDLIGYSNWLNKQNIQSGWPLLSSRDHSRHITGKQFYKTIARTGDLLGVNYLRTYNMRKTGTYRVCTQTRYSTGLAMSLLNHTSEAMTLKYPGLDQVNREKMLDEVKLD